MVQNFNSYECYPMCMHQQGHCSWCRRNSILNNMLAESHLFSLCVFYTATKQQTRKHKSCEEAKYCHSPFSNLADGWKHSTSCQSLPSRLYNATPFSKLRFRRLFPSNRTQHHLPRDLRDATGKRLSLLLISDHTDTRFLSDFHKLAQMSTFNTAKVKKAWAMKEVMNINMSLA